MNLRNLKNGLLASAAVGALSLGLAAEAQAASLASLFFLGERNQLSDNSGEEQNIDLNSNGFLDVGDTLRGTFTIHTFEDKTGGGGTRVIGSGGNNEMSGIFETEVKSRTFVGAGFDGSSGTGDDLYNFVFGPSAAFQAEWEGNLKLAKGALVGTMILVFEDGTPSNYDRTGTIAKAEMTATDGTLRWALGFGGDADKSGDGTGGGSGDEMWTATGAPQSTAIFKTIPSGAALGVFNIQLSMLLELFPGVDFMQVAGFKGAGTGADGMIDILLSGSVLGTMGDAGEYDVANNIDATVRPFGVPEPTSLGILGAGLIGLGAANRRKRNKS